MENIIYKCFKEKETTLIFNTLNNVHFQKVFSPNENAYNLGDSHGKPRNVLLVRVEPLYSIVFQNLSAL